MRQPSDLAVLAETILARVEEVFAAAEIDLPERRYVALGGTVHDCAQVTVSFQQAYLGLPGDQAQTPAACPGPTSCPFLVEVVRTVPAPGRSGAPSAEALHAAGLAQFDDAATLLAVAQTFTGAFGGVIADVVPGEASGGVQGIGLNLVLAVV